MKVHDKYVIELSEVIRGYGNDYQVEEPFNFPCDYKFYEISGVAICEESFKKMKPLTEEVDAVLGKIRAEIESQRKEVSNNHYEDYELQAFNDGLNDGLKDARDILDKYRTESEGKE